MHDDAEVEQTFEAILALGENFFMQGKYEKAQIIFDGLMALSTDQLMPAVLYGEALLMNGHVEKALDHFLMLVQKFAQNDRVLMGTAKACILLGRIAEAKEFLAPMVGNNLSSQSVRASEILHAIS